MTCPYYHKLCGKCRKNVCRAYFPERQPYVDAVTQNICEDDNYAEECLIYPEAVKWREERRRLSLEVHCPFASNTVCGKPWLWLCMAGPGYHPLTEVETGAHETVVLRDGEVVYKLGKSPHDLRETCLSGQKTVYVECPNYKRGMQIRETVNQVKKQREQ